MARITHITIICENEKEQERVSKDITNQLKNNKDYINGNIQIWIDIETDDVDVYAINGTELPDIEFKKKNLRD